MSRLTGGGRALPLLATVTLTACASLPTSGPVHIGLEGAVVEEPYVQAVAAPPVAGASLEQIVQGFLQAMLAGATDDFKVARSYLDGETAAVWDATASVIVYQSGDVPLLAESETEPGEVALTLQQVGAVDAVGRYTAQAPAPATLTLRLSQDGDGEWRISELPDGSAIPVDVFNVDYVAAPIYFPSADGQFLVPDRRVFRRQSAATEAAREFLAGPPQYLRGAVASVAPAGARLETDSVKVVDGVAVVNLSAAMADASESVRATMLSCLTHTLTSLPTVRSVELHVADVPLEVSAAPGLTEDPSAAGGPFYLGDGGVWEHDGVRGALLSGTEAALAWETLSVDHSMTRFAGLVGGALQVIAKPGADLVEVELLGGGPATAPPMFDRLGALWVATGGLVAVYNTEGEATIVSATWLESSRVVALAPSRDGARLALALQDPDSDVTRLVVTGIVRRQGAVPWRLTAPLEAGLMAGPVSSLNWEDGLTLTMLAPLQAGGEPTPAVFTVGGDLSYLLPPTDPPASLASGRTAEEIYTAGSAGGLFSYSPRGRVWTSLGGGARAVTFAP
ncbi:MAG: GerMN domain-containing protein [Bifidobacteriaceae bacterium]|jgi:hypothetical protein|nr:GerMN domain-containing protein [Bifidobacteriaceae bacterium]